jgi:hypothetical protein
MTVYEYYLEAKQNGHYSLELIIDYLVSEKKVLTMTDSEDKLTYYLQDKFAKKMNEHLAEYERVKNNG